MSCTDWLGNPINCETTQEPFIPTTQTVLQTTTTQTVLQTSNSTYCQSITDINAFQFVEMICDYQKLYETCLTGESSRNPQEMKLFIDNIFLNVNGDNTTKSIVDEITLLQYNNKCPFYPADNVLQTTTTQSVLQTTTTQSVLQTSTTVPLPSGSSTITVQNIVDNNPLLTTTLVFTLLIFGGLIVNKIYNIYKKKKDNRKVLVKEEDDNLSL